LYDKIDRRLKETVSHSENNIASVIDDINCYSLIKVDIQVNIGLDHIEFASF